MSSLRLSVLGAAAMLTSLNMTAQNAVTDWNTIASSTIVTSAGEPIAVSGVYFASLLSKLADRANWASWK